MCRTELCRQTDDRFESESGRRETSWESELCRGADTVPGVHGDHECREGGGHADGVKRAGLPRPAVASGHIVSHAESADSVFAHRRHERPGKHAVPPGIAGQPVHT